MVWDMCVKLISHTVFEMGGIIIMKKSIVLFLSLACAAPSAHGMHAIMNMTTSTIKTIAHWIAGNKGTVALVAAAVAAWMIVLPTATQAEARKVMALTDETLGEIIDYVPGKNVFQLKSVSQTDGWSCGYWTMYNMSKVDEAYGYFRGKKATAAQFGNYIKSHKYDVIRYHQFRLKTSAGNQDLKNHIKGQQLLESENVFDIARSAHLLESLHFITIVQEEEGLSQPELMNQILSTRNPRNFEQWTVSTIKTAHSLLSAFAPVRHKPFREHFVFRVNGGHWILISVVNTTGKQEDTFIVTMDSSNAPIEERERARILNFLAQVYMPVRS